MRACGEADRECPLMRVFRTISGFVREVCSMDEKCLKLAGELEGFLFENQKRDLCPVYKNTELVDRLLKWLAEPFRGKADYVASPESVGFILGSMLARELGVGFIPIRNAGISYLEDGDKIVASYIDHHDNVKTLQARKSNFPADSRILLVDDWVDTAATMQTCMTIVEEGGSTVCGIASIGARVTEATRDILESDFLHCVLKK